MNSQKKFKFQFYLEEVEGCRVLWMETEKWEAFKAPHGKPIEIEITKTPMANIAKNATILASVAVRSSDQTAMIDIYRYDKHDRPTPVNKDSYIVMEDILGRSDYQEIVTKSSTSDSQELREFLKSNIGLVKAEPSNDHWLTELPSSVQCVIELNS